MTIAPTSSITGTTATDPSTATSGALTGSKDEFLKLFMAQLEHQDPLNPQDGAGMVAQLAQFSSVEQATQTNQHLADLTSQQASEASASMASLVGRDCSAATGSFQLDHGSVPPIQLTSTSAMNGDSVVISDASGKEIRRIPILAGATSTQVSWDGNTANGTAAAPGSYNLSIDAGTTTGAITSQWHGRIDAVELGNGTTQLRMGGLLLSPGAVQTIGASFPLTQSTRLAP
jgi:flagellar basal-body rod modification protein FlgD